MKVRTDILRHYQAIHTWTGISAGMLLFIAFFGGALTMFKEPLDRWLTPPVQQMSAVNSAELDSLVSQLLSQEPDSHAGFTLYLEQAENILAPIRFGGPERGHELSLSQRYRYATLDERGELQIKETTPTVVAELIDMLHRTAGIPLFAGGDYLGIYVLGVAAMVYFLALVSGVILLLPTLVKDLFALREGNNRKRFWLDAHNIIGITSLPFHIVISLTAIVFAFHDQFYDSLEQAVYREQPLFSAGPAPSQPYQPANILPVSELLTQIQERAPAMTITELMFTNINSPRPLLIASLHNSDYMVTGAKTGYLGLNPYTGDVTRSSALPGQEGVWGSIVSKFFSLHFGSYGGDLVRWLYFALGIGGAFLFYSGNVLWLEKRRNRQKRNSPLPSQNRSAQLLAVITVGVCLGTIAGVCLALSAGKWFFSVAGNTNYTALMLYYSVFCSALGWAFWRGAAKASYQLLLFCALCALSIPLASLTAALTSNTLWVHTSPGTLAVDFTAWVGALCLFYGYKKVRRRALFGPKDSVWAVQTTPRTLASTTSTVAQPQP